MKQRIVENTVDFLDFGEGQCIIKDNDTKLDLLKKVLREQSCPLSSIPKGKRKGKGKGKGKGGGPPRGPSDRSGGGGAQNRGGKGSHDKGASYPR